MAVKISRILHAGYVFSSGETQIAFDPIFENPFSRNCFAFPNVRFDREQIQALHLDAVIISHFHDDHCSLESLKLLNRQTPIFMYCQFDEIFALIKELGFENVKAIKLGEPIEVGAFKITAKRALDSEVDSVFHIQAEGQNILNVVDSWLDPETLPGLKRLAPWDLVLWPFQTLRETDVLSPKRAPKAERTLPPEWVEQLKLLLPKNLIPSSCQFIHEAWSWYNQFLFPITYQQFEKQLLLELPRTKIFQLNPSQSIKLEGHSLEFSNPLEWAQPVGDQNVDYRYQEDLRIPPTSEVAQNFDSLSPDQTERVLQFCKFGLIEKYNSLEESQEPYFQKSRLWQLSLFDHRGQCQKFCYQVGPRHIEIANCGGSLEWLTEIPISRLLGALEEGESLASLYLRINDREFELEIEKQLESADLVEDPLIRVLYSGSVGSYQRAQLRRLRCKDISAP